jgi:hypothetical protein
MCPKIKKIKKLWLMPNFQIVTKNFWIYLKYWRLFPNFQNMPTNFQKIKKLVPTDPILKMCPKIL